MKQRSKIIAFIGAGALLGLSAIDLLDRARRIYEAPETALTIWGFVVRMLSDATPLAQIILAFGLVCLLVATSDWWLPWMFSWAKEAEPTSNQRYPQEKSKLGADAANSSPLKFIDESKEHDIISGSPDTGLDIPIIVFNESEDKSITDVQVELIRVERIVEAGGDMGQPYIKELPLTLTSKREQQAETIPPQREKAFILCKKTQLSCGDSRLVLAPNSQASVFPALRQGRYLFSLVASGKDTPPVKQTYSVSMSQTNFSYRFCTSAHFQQPKQIPEFRASPSGTVIDVPDYEKWDKRETFYLWEAAFLSAGQEPPQPQKPFSNEAEICFRQLVGAIYDGTIPVRGDNLREVIAHRQLHKKGSEAAEPNPQWQVTREDLKIYYQGVGKRPPFLFPKKRI